MRTSPLLLASSLIALAASAANAQVTTVGSNKTEIFNEGQDNKAQVENTAEGNDRNNAVIIFNGNGNRTAISQVGDDNGAKTAQHSNNNSSSVRQLGLRNSATLTQVGIGNGSNIDQYLDPRIGIYGDRIAVVEQWGDGNSSSVVQVNANNVARVTQGDGTGRSHGAVSTIYQYSSGNTATVRMFGGSPDAANRSHIEQTRIDPVLTKSEATVDINGSFNLSYLYQVGAGNVGQHTVTGTQNTIIAKSYGNALQSSVLQQGYRNFTILNQFAGDRNSSRIEQLDGGDRQVFVSQGGSDNSSTVIQRSTVNAVVVNQSGAGTVSSVSQNGTGNFARANLFEGSPDGSNRSTITQNLDFRSVDTRHVADVTVRGLGNESSVSQTGQRHVASVDISGGGTGLEGGIRRRGNSVNLEQSSMVTHLVHDQVTGGAGHNARVQIGSVPGGGVGTVTSIQQLGQHRNIGNDVFVGQDGQYDSVTVLQSTRFAQTDGGAVANISARGVMNRVSVSQYGRQFATITQGVGGESTFSAFQYDSAGSRFAEAFYAGGRGNNSISAAQYGDRNSVGIVQEGTDNGATVWQQTGSSDNSISINQGGNRPAGPQDPLCSFRCQFANLAVATVTQSSRFNSASTEQYGGRGTARIEQYGTGSSALRNSARISQASAGEASILQTAQVGPSQAGDPSSGAVDDPSYFAGGARSSEARILQRAGGLLARIEQRGRGQYAFIDQSGANTASILQDVGATNATAIIVQSGSGNSYSVVQDRPGQYISVSQTGSNNEVTNVIRRGPGS